MFAIKLVTLTINMCSINNFMNFAFLSKCDFGENFLDLSKDILLITPKKLTSHQGGQCNFLSQSSYIL